MNKVLVDMTADWTVDSEFLFTYLQLDLSSNGVVTNAKEQNGPNKIETHFYDYIELLPDDDEKWKRAYSLLATDLMLYAGVRIQDFRDAIARNIYLFGAEKAFFEEDRKLVMDFCRMVICVYQKFRKRQVKYLLENKFFTTEASVPQQTDPASLELKCTNGHRMNYVKVPYAFSCDSCGRKPGNELVYHCETKDELGDCSWATDRYGGCDFCLDCAQQMSRKVFCGDIKEGIVPAMFYESFGRDDAQDRVRVEGMTEA